MQLSPNKQGLLSRLLSRKDLVNALDGLLPYPGLWNDFELGSLHKQFAMHFDEAPVCYLRHIYTTLDAITLGEEDIREALDPQTVENLHLLAPSASSLDRRYINQHMDLPPNRSGLFPRVEDREKRNLIKQALLRLEVIIPTIKSFQENRIYLSIGANIIETLLLDEGPKSIYKAMYAHWTEPETILKEFREGEYRSVTLGQPDMAFRFCFMQVFIAALRQSPNLGGDPPLIEPTSKKRKRDPHPPVGVISGSVNTAYRNQFLRRAQLNGFRTKKIINGLRVAEDLVVEVPEPFTEDSDGEVKTRRSGKPYTNAYKHLRTQLFLTNLCQARAESGLNPSVMFVQQDFINAFFDWTRGSRWNFAPSTTQIPLSELAAPPEPVLPEAVAASEPEVFVEPRVMEINNTPREAVSLQSRVSSEPTLVISPQPRAYIESSERWSQSSLSDLYESDIEPAEHWSQFSLPNLDESDSEGDHNRQQNQREHSLPMPDDRRSFPATELSDRGDEHPSSPTVDLQDINILNTTPTDNSEGRSFPEPEFRNGDMRDDRRSEPRGEDDERRSFPTVDLQGVDIWSPASMDNSRRRSFPALELLDVDVEGGRHSFPAPELREDDEHRSFPTADLQDMLDENRSFRTAEVQSMSASDLPERRSFPALEWLDGDVENGRRSFPAPELYDVDMSGRRQPYVAVGAQSSLVDGGTAVNQDQPRPFAFVEYNGMRKSAKSTSNMEQYLQQRQGWTMMVLRNQVLKTIRFESIVEHMRRQEGEKYFLIASQYAEHFRMNHLNSTSSV